MKKKSLILLTTILTSSLSGCSYYFENKSATERRVDMIIAESYSKYEDRDITFERLTIDFTPYHEPPVIISNANHQESSRLIADGSQVNTLFDGFGNKTETRYFFNDPLIKFVIVKTSAKGEQQAFVYAQNGEVKSVPEEFLERIMFSGADEIAGKVEIYEGRKDKELLVNAGKTQVAQPIPTENQNDIKSQLNPQETPNVVEVKKENQPQTKNENTEIKENIIEEE